MSRTTRSHAPITTLCQLCMGQLPENECLASFLLRKQHAHCIAKPLPASHDFLLASHECTCPEFLKYSACKHVIGYFINVGFLTMPPELNITRIGRNRRPGSPRNVGPALTPMDDMLQHIEQEITDFPDDFAPDNANAIWLFRFLMFLLNVCLCVFPLSS